MMRLHDERPAPYEDPGQDEFPSEWPAYQDIPVLCQLCGGSGAEYLEGETPDQYDEVDCPACGGTGWQ